MKRSDIIFCLLLILIMSYDRKNIYGQELVVTQGGTYSGIWNNNDPTSSAVEIRTSDPVIIEKSTINSRGNLIKNFSNNAKVTIRDCYMEGLNKIIFTWLSNIYLKNYKWSCPDSNY